MAVVRKRSNFAIWQDVIFAIFLREIRSRFNDRVGISWAVISPVAFIFVLSFIRGRMGGNEVHTIPIFIFMMYGMVGVQLFLKTFSSCSNAIKKSKPLYAFRQVQPISAVIAVALFEFMVFIFILVVLYLIIYLLDIEHTISFFLHIIALYTLIWLFAVSIGLVFSILSGFVEEVNKVKELMTRPLFFISGIFFSLQDIPKEYWHWLDWNPLLHGIELIRDAAYPTYTSEGVSLSFLLLCVLSFMTLGLFLYTAYWRQIVSR